MKMVGGFFFIVYGILSLLFGVLNKRYEFWGSISKDVLEKIFKKKFDRISNIFFGCFAILVGILILVS